MAPHVRAFTVLLTLTLAQISLSSANPADFYEISREYDSSNKVTVSLYYESLCPYCADFIVNHLVKMFQTDLINIVNLRFVPWGNSQILGNGTWVCQHGDDECLLDVVEACATRAWPNVKDHFKFIRCIENLHLMNKHTEWRSCFRTTGLDPKPLDNCYNSDFARQ
ncbi:Thioredoxin superfamily protein, partial [Striga hermonthica]